MKRNQLVDVTKGIAIICVVLGHSISVVPSWQENVISQRIVHIVCSFHMPLFFMIAGYLMFVTIKGNRLTWLRNKAYYLLIPHIVFGIAYYYLSAIGLPPMPDLTKESSFLAYALSIILLDAGDWFLQVLFLVFACMLWVDWMNSRLRNWLFLSATLIFLILILMLYGEMVNVRFLGFNSVLYYLPYAVIGYCVAKYLTQVKAYIYSKHWLFWGIWLLELGIQVFRFSVPWYYHLTILGVYGVAAIAKGRTWLTLAELVALPCWMYFWFFASPSLSGSLFRYPLALAYFPLVITLAWGITKVRYLDRAFAWLGQSTLGIYLFSLGTSNLGLGEGVVRMFTNCVGSFSVAVVLTWVVNRYKALRLILGDISILTWKRKSV